MNFLLGLLLLTGFAQSGDRPIESAHVSGPNGLEGWTLRNEVEGLESQGPLPMSLVIARKGKVLRRIAGDPFLWRWKFASSGKLIAYESGPLHFALNCALVDIASGKQVAQYDCFYANELPLDAPQWVKELETDSQ